MSTPSPSLIDQQAQLLRAHAPFSAMRLADVVALLAGAREAYYAPGEAVFTRGEGFASKVCIVKRGRVTVEADDGVEQGRVHFESGQMFPLASALAQAPVAANHVSAADTFCWEVPVPLLQEVAARSVVLSEALTAEAALLLKLSRKALQIAFTSYTYAQFSMERPLGEMPRKSLLVCKPEDSLGQALASMQTRAAGSILVADDLGRCVGIFTLKDVIAKAVLAGVSLDEPIRTVMTAPVHILGTDESVEEAALLMARRGIRHVPVVDRGDGDRLVNIVSERDLYALQRLSLNQISSSARRATDVSQLVQVAQDIRQLARSLVSQGVHAKSLTRLISKLNDVLTERLVHLVLERHQLAAHQLCWLSFGSEGRSEQTIATDQDNGLIFRPDEAATDGLEPQRRKWLGFALEVNHALDACGYPLCKGNIMASNPECCLTLDEWKARFDHWIKRGTPEDLLRANIFFDLRPLAGNAALGQALSQHVLSRPSQVPRFLFLLAQDMLKRSVPLNWLGNIETVSVGGQESIDLKLRGTALFVDAARLRSLALGVEATNTRERFEACALAAGKSVANAQNRADAFEFLQMLRLRVQLAPGGGPSSPDARESEHLPLAGAVPGHPNAIAVNELSDIDRKLLRESLRVARELQQETQMDFGS